MNNNINKNELYNNNLKGIIEVVEILSSDDDNIKIIPRQLITDYFQKLNVPNLSLVVIDTHIPSNRYVKDILKNEKEKWM